MNVQDFCSCVSVVQGTSVIYGEGERPYQLDEYAEALWRLVIHFLFISSIEILLIQWPFVLAPLLPSVWCVYVRARTLPSGQVFRKSWTTALITDGGEELLLAECSNKAWLTAWNSFGFQIRWGRRAEIKISSSLGTLESLYLEHAAKAQTIVMLYQMLIDFFITCSLRLTRSFCTQPISSWVGLDVRFCRSAIQQMCFSSPE